MKPDDKGLREIISRLERLEHAVFGSRRKAASKAPTDTKKYKGATGGIRLLVDKGFFDKKRSFGEIRKALEGKGYHFTKQAVQTPLKTFSFSRGKILVALTEKGRKLYAKRK